VGDAPSEPVVGLLAEEWQQLLALGAELAAEEWDLPSECPGWTVRDLVSHMVGTERSLMGEAAPPPPPAGPHVRNALGAGNEAWVAARRSRTGDEVLAEFLEVTGRRLRQLRELQPEDFDRAGPSPIGTVAYREFMSVRVMDCWVHEQDMRVATGRPGHRLGPVADLAFDRLASAMPFVVAKKAGAPEGASVCFELCDVPGRRVEVAVRNGRGVRQRVDDPTSTLVMDSELFWRLCCGRVTGEAALDAGLVIVHGDAELAGGVARNMAFMI
jgi:uncharacterized protein (TIGR03083 family)